MARRVFFGVFLLAVNYFVQISTENASENLIERENQTTLDNTITKSRTFYDYQTRVAAVKDLIDSKCYIKQLSNGEILSNSISKNGKLNKSANLFLSNKLSKRQIYRLAGPRISEFCRGFPTYLAKEITNDDSNIDIDYLNDLPMDDEDISMEKVRITKRSTNHFFVGRIQSQSQYLNYGQSKEPGKAEAESTYQGSKAVVSGSSGMGQAQSQSIPFSGCEGCYEQDETHGDDQTQVLHYRRPGNYQSSESIDKFSDSGKTSKHPEQQYPTSETGVQTGEIRPQQPIGTIPTHDRPRFDVTNQEGAQPEQPQEAATERSHESQRPQTVVNPTYQEGSYQPFQTTYIDRKPGQDQPLPPEYVRKPATISQKPVEIDYSKPGQFPTISRPSSSSQYDLTGRGQYAIPPGYKPTDTQPHISDDQRIQPPQQPHIPNNQKNQFPQIVYQPSDRRTQNQNVKHPIPPGYRPSSGTYQGGNFHGRLTGEFLQEREIAQTGRFSGTFSGQYELGNQGRYSGQTYDAYPRGPLNNENRRPWTGQQPEEEYSAPYETSTNKLPSNAGQPLYTGQYRPIAQKYDYSQFGHENIPGQNLHESTIPSTGRANTEQDQHYFPRPPGQEQSQNRFNQGTIQSSQDEIKYDQNKQYITPDQYGMSPLLHETGTDSRYGTHQLGQKPLVSGHYIHENSGGQIASEADRLGLKPIESGQYAHEGLGRQYAGTKPSTEQHVQEGVGEQQFLDKTSGTQQYGTGITDISDTYPQTGHRVIENSQYRPATGRLPDTQQYTPSTFQTGDRTSDTYGSRFEPASNNQYGSQFGIGRRPQVTTQDSYGQYDDSDSQVQTSVQQNSNGTHANAQAQGRHEGGTAQSQVSGSYTGSGSFSASAGSDDGKRGAQTQVAGGKDGAKSSAQGRGGLGRSQSQVILSSETGDTMSSAQSGGINHSSQTQVQASGKGGLADAQSNGPGNTSSQAQIGFSPYDNDEQDNQRIPFRGGGTASAQGGPNSGLTQSQIQGKFRKGIKYVGAAQAGSGATNFNQTRPSGFTPFTPLQFGKSNFGSISTKNEPLTMAVSDTQTTNLTKYENQEENEDTVTTLAPDDDYNEEDYDENQYDDSSSKPSPPSIKQKSNSQRQHIVLDPLEDLDATVHQSSGDFPEDGTVLQPGETIPGSDGYQIPIGFRGRVKSMASGANTYTIGQNSQAQSVTLTPGTGRIIYNRRYVTPMKRTVVYSPVQTIRSGGSYRRIYKPVYVVGSNAHLRSGQIGYGSGYTYQPAQYQIKSGNGLPNFVSVSKSETGSKNPTTGVQTLDLSYTHSSSCGIFTNTCVFNGSGRLCFPKPATHSNGALIGC